MQLGVALPLTDIGGDPGTVRAFAQTAEEYGFDYLSAPDHVLGVNVASRPDWGDRSTSADLMHDPFVLFAFLSGCTRKIGFAVGVLILAQRQAVLVAKQAASLAMLSEGRFRLGVGIGWNKVEFTGLNENFHDRGKRSEEQVQVMQKLWAEQHVTFKGKWHTIEDAGINPRPPGGKVPIWYGGHEEVTLRRIAKWGDGWMMLAHPAGETAVAEFAKLRRFAAEEGRDPAGIGLEVWTSAAEGGPADWRREVQWWKSTGVTHVTVANWYARGHHKRIAERTVAAHVAAMKQYRDAVADLL